MLLPFLAVLWLCSTYAFAQVEQWQSYIVAGNRSYQRGDYAEAEKQWGLVLKEAKQFSPQDPRLVTTLSSLAALHQAQGKYAEAEPIFKRALVIFEKTLGSEHPLVAANLNNLAALYHAQGKYAEAEPLCKQALAIVEKALGPEHPHVATNLENYAALLRKTGRGEEAEKLEVHARAIRAKHARQNPAK